MKINIFSQWNLPGNPGSQLAITGALRKRLGSLSDDYDSPIPSLFLYGLKKTEALRRSEQWLARDGLMPLLLFFRRFPNPPSFKTRIYIDPALSRFVPQAWKKCIGTYEFVTDRDSLKRKLLIFGFLTPDGFNADYQKIFFDHYRKTLSSSQSRYGEIVLSVHFDSSEKTAQSRPYLEETFSRLFSNIGTKVTTSSRFQWPASLENHDFLELNDGNWCLDSTPRFNALSAGASLIGPQYRSGHRAKGRKIQISAHHSVVLRPLSKARENLSPFEKDLLNYRRLAAWSLIEGSASQGGK